MNPLDTLDTATVASTTNDSHYHSLSIAQAIRMIQANEIALPLLQRDLVWEAKKALGLFDSVMQSYPINSMLLWDVRKENVGQVPMYSFIRHYTTYLGSDSLLEALHNNKQVPTEVLAQNAEKGQLLAVLDGQQRRGALSMGGILKTTISSPGNYSCVYPTAPMKLRLTIWRSAPCTGWHGNASALAQLK